MKLYNLYSFFLISIHHITHFILYFCYFFSHPSYLYKKTKYRHIKESSLFFKYTIHTSFYNILYTIFLSFLSHKSCSLFVSIFQFKLQMIINKKDYKTRTRIISPVKKKKKAKQESLVIILQFDFSPYISSLILDEFRKRRLYI